MQSFVAARRARRRLAHLDLQRRDQRAEEVELTERADGLAERRAAKDRIHGECDHEIGQHDPCREPGAGPQAEAFVDEEESQHQRRCQPFVAQHRWHGPPAAPETFAQPARGLPRQHKGTCHAKQIARDQQRQDDQPAVVQPHAHRREVLGRQLRAEQPVEDDERREEQHRRLHGCARVLPLEEAAHQGPSQDVRGAARGAIWHGRRSGSAGRSRGRRRAWPGCPHTSRRPSSTGSRWYTARHPPR